MKLFLFIMFSALYLLVKFYSSAKKSVASWSAETEMNDNSSLSDVDDCFDDGNVPTEGVESSQVAYTDIEEEVSAIDRNQVQMGTDGYNPTPVFSLQQAVILSTILDNPYSRDNNLHYPDNIL